MNRIESISVIIPAYNESFIISKTIQEVLSFLKNHASQYEIIVVDDGSTDNTSEILSQFPEIITISYTPNRGKGYAVKKGVERASMEYVLFMDADHSIAITNVKDMMNHINLHPIVIGSKYIANSSYSAYRKFIGRLFSLLRNVITGLSHKDTQCGFKLFKTGLAKKLFSKLEVYGWCFDVEILMLAKNDAISVLELPVEVIPRKGDSKISILSSSVKMLWDLYKIRRKFIA